MFMRRAGGVSFVLLASVSLSGYALADGYEAPRAAAVMLQVSNWTGFYVGTHTGGALGQTDISDPYGNPIFGDKVRLPGPLAGGQIGYNYQMGMTVVGLEADASWADLDGTNTCFAFSGFFLSSNCHVHVDALGTLTGRLGWAVGPGGRTLLYGKGGAAWEHENLDATVAGSVISSSTSSSDTRWGWTVGGGIEHAVTGNWSVKAEYDFLSFGNHNFKAPDSLFQVVPGNPGTFVFVPGPVTSVSDDIHLFKVGLNYRFGGGSSTPWDSEWGYGSLKDGSVRTPLGTEFEMGARYAYGWGRFQKDLVPQSPISRLTYNGMNTNGGELFARLDTPHNLMVKGFLGAGTGGGHMNDEDFALPAGLLYPGSPFIPYTNTLSSKVDDQIRYGTIDVGYDWLRSRAYKLSPFIGYNYFRQNMDAFGCAQQADPLAGCSAGNGGNFPPIPATGSPIITEHDKWQSLRLGTAAEFTLSPGLKLSGEVAYLPYVKFNGVDHHFFGNTGILAETFPESGHGTGVQLEAMLSYALTNNFSLGVGGRYWGMWTKDGEYSCSFGCPGSPTSSFPFRAATEQAALLVQGTYKFGSSEPAPLK